MTRDFFPAKIVFSPASPCQEVFGSGGESLPPSLLDIVLALGDMLKLCCDGLTDSVSDEEVNEVVGSEAT